MSRTTIDSKVVDVELRGTFWPELQAGGFRRGGRTAWRERPDAIQVVNVQSFNRYLADALGVTTFSFALNLGVFYPAIAPLSAIGMLVPDPARPAEYVCQARLHLTKGLAQPVAASRRRWLSLVRGTPPTPARVDRPDVWFIEADGRNLEGIVSDARERVLGVGIPWLDAMSDLGEARRRFHEVEGANWASGVAAEDYGGAIGSPNRWVAIAGLSIALRDVPGATWALGEMSNHPFFQQRPADLAAIRSAISAEA